MLSNALTVRNGGTPRVAASHGGIIEIRDKTYRGGQCLKSNGQFYGIAPRTASASLDGKRYPTDVLLFDAKFNGDRINPTQKPVDLLEFLVRTYTNEGQVVLDPFMGSGSCGVACVRTGRKFIGMEKDPTFFDGAKAWIASEQKSLTQDQ